MKYRAFDSGFLISRWRAGNHKSLAQQANMTAHRATGRACWTGLEAMGKRHEDVLGRLGNDGVCSGCACKNDQAGVLPSFWTDGRHGRWEAADRARRALMSTWALCNRPAARISSAADSL